MTEERIKEWAEKAGVTKKFIENVAAEARQEGIEAAVEIALPCLIESENIKKIFTLEIARLKKKGGSPDCPKAGAFPYELWNHLWSCS